MLKTIKPTSLALQSISILLPDAVNTLEVTLIRKLSEKFGNHGYFIYLPFINHEEDNVLA